MMTRLRVHLVPAFFLILSVLLLAALLLATVHLAAADCIIGPGVICPPDDPLPPRAYIPAIW